MTEPGIGHNSGDEEEIVTLDTAAGKRIKSFLERIERLTEEKDGIAADIKDIYAEAKSVGFDVKTMRKLIRLRKMDANKRAEEEMMLETYKSAIGFFD